MASQPIPLYSPQLHPNPDPGDKPSDTTLSESTRLGLLGQRYKARRDARLVAAPPAPADEFDQSGEGEEADQGYDLSDGECQRLITNQSPVCMHAPMCMHPVH